MPFAEPDPSKRSRNAMHWEIMLEVLVQRNPALSYAIVYSMMRCREYWSTKLYKFIFVCSCAGASAGARAVYTTAPHKDVQRALGCPGGGAGMSVRTCQVAESTQSPEKSVSRPIISNSQQRGWNSKPGDAIKRTSPTVSSSFVSNIASRIPKSSNPRH